jgi:hypothetical protein
MITHARHLTGPTATPFRFSICTLVTRPAEYAEMMASFVQQGFTPADCEYLYVQNTDGNQFDGYSGYNLFLQEARGEFIILCHQDILLRFDGRKVLEQRLAELTAAHPDWAVAGNAGAKWSWGAPMTALRISDDAGEHDTGHFPICVEALDENFMVVQRAANLCLSHDLAGFHFYATDLCRIANILGRTAWVIDFHLFHKSRGNLNEQFYEVRDQLIRKYGRALRGGALQTVCTRVYLSSHAFTRWGFNLGARATLFQRAYSLQKQSREPGRAEFAVAARDCRARLGEVWYAWFWLRHKINRPFENLRRWFGKKRQRAAANACR